MLLFVSFLILVVFVQLTYPSVVLIQQILFEFVAKVDSIFVFNIFQYLHPRQHVYLNMIVNDRIIRVFVHMCIKIV